MLHEMTFCFAEHPSRCNGKMREYWSASAPHIRVVILKVQTLQNGNELHIYCNNTAETHKTSDQSSLKTAEKFSSFMLPTTVSHYLCFDISY